MRAFIQRAGASAIAAALVSTAGLSVRADELLVMPYTCAMVGGRPLLTPAPEQGHAVLGRREQRPFTACSPANPEMCRNWTVHRFDIDCQGARVSWVDVVAAATEHTGDRVRAEGGRLLLRMPRNWSFGPDDPCARPPGFEDRFLFGRMRRYCNDRSAMAPPVVEMPFGFAPMLGIDGIFVQSSAPAVSNAAPLPAQPPAAAVPPFPPPKVARAEPPPRPEPAPSAHADVPAEPQPREAPVKSEAPPQVAIKPPPAHTTPPAPAPAVKLPQAVSPPASPGGPVVPKIINRPEGGAGETAEPPASAVAAPQQAPAPAPKAGPNAAAPGIDASQPRPAPAAEPPPAVTVSLLSYARSPAVGAIAALSGLAVVLLAAFAVARRRERLRPAGPPPHEFASVSFDSPKTSANLVWAQGGPPANPRPVAPVPKPPARRQAHAPQAHLGVAPTLIDRIPQTRAEAVNILGIGVMPDTSETAMKKIVDGLRLSWHPDLAKNDDDRHLREFRIKQINAAWDLIQGRRMERLDS